MQRIDQTKYGSRRAWATASILSALLLSIALDGCGGSIVSSTSNAATQTSPQKYLAVSNGGSDTYSFIIDDAGTAFTQESFAINSQQQGLQVDNAGVFTASQRGLLSLGLEATYNFNSNTNNWIATTYNPPAPGGFAIQLASQAGGLEQLPGQPVAILVPTAAQCPTIATAQTYQFLTIPAGLIPPGTSATDPGWDPTSETAFGTVDISTSGNTVNFNNIQQFILGSSAPTSAPSVAGVCGSTAYGNTISVPGQIVVTNTGSIPSQAIVAIGPTGLLVEDNGMNSVTTAYVTALGAGGGAVGLPKPTGALDSGALPGAQYLGFIYGAGVYRSIPWSSHLVSFGFSAVPASCPAVTASTSTPIIYGGDFADANGNDNPSTFSSGYGKCDLAIDLGSPDASNSGLFSNARVSIFPSYPGIAATDSFKAVAIAGQLNKKYAIFVLGVDSTQPWAIYLLQSN